MVILPALLFHIVTASPTANILRAKLTPPVAATCFPASDAASATAPV